MASKIILDANIFLDLILKRSGDYEELDKIYQGITAHRFQGFVTTSIVHTCGYRLTKAFNESQAKKVLIGMLNDTQIIDAPHKIVEAALHSDMKDIETALQYYTSIHHDLDVFISKDNDFIKAAKPVLPVLRPKEFVRQYIDNQEL